MKTAGKLIATLAYTLVLLAGPAMAQDSQEIPDDLDTLDELDTIIIVGGYASPKLWKVSRGDHVMWVLGNSGPAPQGVKWRTEELEARVSESQEVLYPGWVKAGPDIGLLRAITLLPAAFKAAKNPHNGTLKDVLPPETYARWRALKTAYLGRDNEVEKWRPSFAIEQLQNAVIKKSGLMPPRPTMGPSLRAVVDKAAKKYKVKIRTLRTVEREIKVNNAREILKSARDTDFGDVQCFTQTLGYIEHIVEFAKQKANGTAQNTNAPSRGQSCDDFLINGLKSGAIPDPAGALKVLDEIELQSKLGHQQLDAEWLAAAQAALKKNRSTFAVLSMREVTRPDGYLAKLRELGYEVVAPDSVVN